MQRFNSKRIISILVMVAMILNICMGCATDRKNLDAKQPKWTKDMVVYEVNVRQYTEEGTFDAFSEHLPRIKEMGVDTLWFMPIHPISEKDRSGELGSYYSVSDYCDINPEFGTKEDFKELVDKAHEMGFKVMMDWVANHTGWDCDWVRLHPEWYTQDEQGKIVSPQGMGWPDVADLNYANEDLQEEMISCMKYWIEEFDIDGFRCDYATGVPIDFWEKTRSELDEIKDIYMIAEAHPTEELLSEAFDCCYNWDLYHTLVRVAQGEQSAESIKNYMFEDLPQGTCTLNYLDNHDINSYQNTLPDAFGENALPAMFALIYTMPGIPLIYSGDEIGLNHNLAFMEKDTINWNLGTRSYSELLKELSSIREENKALHTGIYGGDIHYYDLQNEDVLAFYREKEKNIVKCIFNMSDKTQYINVSEMFEDEETLVLEPWEYLILSEK